MCEYWYPFFPEEYKKATRHLTAEQDGIYRRLIDEYMETREPLPDNDIALARIAGVSEIKWLDAKRIVIAYFTHKNGMISHQFCDQQLDIQDKRSRRRSESAEKAAKKRWKNNKQKQELKCAPHARPMRGDATVTDTSTDTKKKEKIYKKENDPYFNEFWELYPRQRRGDKDQTWKAWQKSITEKKTTAKEIIDGVQKYINSSEVRDGYAKGAAAWINAGKYSDTYEIPAKGNGKFDKGQSYSSQILAATERAGEQLQVREDEWDIAEGQDGAFNEEADQNCGLLPAPSDIGPDTIPFAPISDAQEDGRE